MAKPVYRETLVKSDAEIREVFGETIKMNARRDILPIQEILENSAKDLTPEEIEEKILGGKVYDSKPQRETVACNPLPIRFHRIMWTKTKGFQKAVYLS